MTKKVLFLCQYFYPEYVSSATLPTQLAEDMIKKGFSVDVICGMPKEYVKEKDIVKQENYNGINIRRLNYTEFNNKSKIGRIINFFSLFVAYGLNIPKMLKYDHILVYSNPPILPLIPDIIHRVTKKKYSFVVYDIAPDNAIKTGATRPGSLIDRLMKYINKHVYKNASNVIVLGNEMKEYILENKISTNPESIRVISNWYDEANLKPNKIYSEKFKALREKYKKILVYSGNMGQLQDMDTVLEFLKLNRNSDEIFTILSGHGKKQNYVKQFIKNNNIKNAIVYDFLTGTDYSDVLAVADICLVSLVKEGKGLGVPSKIYGYLAARKPIVAILDESTDIVNEITEYNAGVHIGNGDAQKLYQYINDISNKELALQGQNAYEIYQKNYTRNISTDKYIKLLK
ncbi:glycosyltransferase WbuB [Macrococcus epidermidis]|uniref:Glycosyltransferase WbuB n=1 Tax=Macrococcus epidermidis TaxID=1902580 RepID=A0A327ZPK3_9STAP|nr:glycosyltransferase family 4 protein [Macrococcus epidermidis]RAK44105.1 glycosyltransferase WbuB [Macrococcus epidermidis]